MKARRAFRALNGIIRLQALIRGHLVRRQAVATLCSMLGIVKFQALVRGIRVRHSDVGLEVQKRCSLTMPLVNICEQGSLYSLLVWFKYVYVCHCTHAFCLDC